MEKPIEQEIARGIAKRIAKGIAMAITAIIVLTIFVFLGGKVVQWLWNWLLPPLFGFPAVTYWQALGLLALSRILFGGLGMGGQRGSRRKWGRDMSPEREKFELRRRERWRCEPETGETTGQQPS